MLQLFGSIIGIILLALGGVLLIDPLYTIIFWAVQIGDAPDIFIVTETYVSTVLETMLGVGLMGVGLVLILWSRPR